MNHCVVIEPVPDGWHAYCIPHGPITTHPNHLAVFIAAAEHDREHGGDTT